MPSRGYRKGISDRKVPRPHVVKSRTSTPTLKALRTECTRRNLTLSELVHRVLDAHAANTRVELPRPTLNPALLRQLTRLGNNLNQLTRQANLMRLHLVETESSLVLAKLMGAIDKLA